MALDPALAGAIAATRFGLGAKPGEIAAARSDPRSWLSAQIRPAGADLPRGNPEPSAQRLTEFREFERFRRPAAASAASAPGPAGADANAAPDASAAAGADPVKMARRLILDEAGADFLARVQLGANTDAGFRERWALFWCNHFTVSAAKVQTATIIGPFETEAIRPRVFGRFEDLLVASSSHPAMLLYLDQAQSFGPDTVLAHRLEQNGKQPGINENLAREILELHTVGVDAGYTQGDVTEFARALTGWSVGALRDQDGSAGAFKFRRFAHEPGARTIMGRTYAEDGQAQALAVMHDLAASPHTARHLALKLARHFVADDPPQTLVDRMQRAYLSSDGDLAEVARSLIAAPEAWTPEARKFKTPYEFMVSAWRAAGVVPDDVTRIAQILSGMGQKPSSAPSPKGWDEAGQAWCDPDGVIKRMAWSETFAAQSLAGRDPSALAQAALGARLTPLVAAAIARAETREEGMAILLMSPEFQRR